MPACGSSPGPGSSVQPPRCTRIPPSPSCSGPAVAMGFAGRPAIASPAAGSLCAPRRRGCGERKEIEVAGQVSSADGRWQLSERPEGEQVANPAERLTRRPAESIHPIRQWSHSPFAAQHAQPGLMQPIELVRDSLAVSSVQQPIPKKSRLFGRSLDSRCGKETPPKRPGRPLLTAAERVQRMCPSSVLGAGQCEWQEKHKPLVLQFPGSGRQLGRPVRIVLRDQFGERLRRLTRGQFGE